MSGPIPCGARPAPDQLGGNPAVENQSATVATLAGLSSPGNNYPAGLALGGGFSGER